MGEREGGTQRDGLALLSPGWSPHFTLYDMQKWGNRTFPQVSHAPSRHSRSAPSLAKRPLAALLPLT